MRRAYFIIGLGVVIVALGAWLAFNRSFSPAAHTENGIINSSTTAMAGTLTLTSTAFLEGASIPSKYTCDGDQVNPPLAIGGVPAGTVSLVLIMDDPDVPKQLRPDGVFDHWVVFNIAPSTTAIETGVHVGVSGANGAGKNAYTGPCPPAQYEPSTHRYIFSLYALDSELALREGASKQDVQTAMQGHIIDQAQLIGKYKKK